MLKKFVRKIVKKIFLQNLCRDYGFNLKCIHDLLCKYHIVKYFNYLLKNKK
jgi:hypothetical protein